MRISAIKFSTHTDSEPTIYRFVPKAGQRSNLYCHLGHPENLKNVIKAIQCCLCSEPQEAGVFRSVQLQLIDESGNVWTIEQKGEKRNYYQNDKVIEGDIRTTQLGALLDWDTGDDNTHKNPDPFKFFELAIKGNEISALPTTTPLSGTHSTRVVNLSIS